MADEPEIIVLGSATTTADHFDELLAAALAHVHRSRAEPGCLAHGVSIDAEDPMRLVFVERWADRAALDVHFAQPGSHEFVAVVSRVAVGDTQLDLHRIQPRT